ncbi:MAG: hypothetical protein IJN15_03305, partial [Clostridia bacterium]|nr:hypothetical protein [Clostridia bacterium]
QGGFDYYHNLSSADLKDLDISATETEDGKTLFTVKIKKDLPREAIGFYRRIDVNGFRSVKLLGSYKHQNEFCKSTLATDKKDSSIIMLADMYDDFVSFGAPLNSHIYASRNHLSLDGDFVTIPAEAKYAYIGFDIRKEGGLKADTYCVISDMTYEFL